MRLRSRASLSAGLWAAALVLIGIAPGAKAATEDLKKVTSVEGITEYRLANGLRVLLFPDPTRPKATVNLTIFVGSRHEGYGETGMAHLLEHMLFKGTPTHPDIPGAMKERGPSSTERPGSIEPITTRRCQPATRISSMQSASKPTA